MNENEGRPKIEFVDAAELKSYLYESRAKIDAHYQQLRAPRKRTTVEWKVDLKVLSVSRKTEHDGEVSDHDKLKTVLRELESLELIGSVDEGKPYIKGIFPMRWGIYNDSGMRPDNEGPLVYFSGYADGLLLGLGGSSHHIVGCYGIGSTASRSSTPALVQFLRSGLDTGEASPPYWRNRREELDEVFTAMAIANGYLKGPIQDLEFAGKVLCRGNARGLGRYVGVSDPQADSATAILATPLYVSQVDPMEEDG